MKKNYALPALVILLFLQNVFAQNPSLVSDINTQSLAPDIDHSGSLNAAGGLLFFNATDNHGFGLWRSDGTQAGTYFLTTETQAPYYYGTSIDYKGALYYADENTASVWKTDGSLAGTTLITPAVVTEHTNGQDQYFAISNGTLFFGAETKDYGTELWKSDGTPEGTTMVKDIETGGGASYPEQLTPFNDKLIFIAYTSANGSEPYITDGTANGTHIIKDIIPGVTGSYPGKLVAYNGDVYFFANDGIYSSALWKTDGTEAGTTEVKVFDTGDTRYGGVTMTVANGKLLMSAYTDSVGEELWVSDGTTDGTQLLYDINPGPNSSNFGYPPLPFFVSGNYAYFAAGIGDDYDEYQQLWRSDGTVQGTTMVADLSGHTPYNFASLPDGKVVFTTYSYYNDSLWVTDGTTEGTLSIDRQFFDDDQDLLSLTAFQGKVYFVASHDQGDGPSILCYTDGTLSGTQQFPVSSLQTFSSSPSQMVKLGQDNFVLAANDGIHGTELYGTDGRSTVTLLKDCYKGSHSSDISICPQSLNGEVFFSAADTTIGSSYSDYKIYKTDGTPVGTSAIKACAPRFSIGYAYLDNVLYFVNRIDNYNFDLWRSDGTDSGTYQFNNIDTDNPTNGDHFVVLNNEFYFGANDGSYNFELWKSDGTAEGTLKVKEINASEGCNPGYMAVCNGKIYFSANDGIHGVEPWVSDGTEQGTIMLKDIFTGYNSSSPSNFTAVGNNVFFQAKGKTTGSELWRTDGTPQGTHLAADIYGGSNSSVPKNLININGTLFFSAIDSGSSHAGLWEIDYATQTLEQVKDFSELAYGEDIAEFKNVAGDLYFIGGNTMWRSDGTGCRTQELDFSREGDDAEILLVDSNSIFFTLTSEQYGTELYKYITSPITTYEVCNGLDDDCNGIIDDNAIATIIPDTTVSVCKGSSVALTANSGVNVSYQWMKNGKEIDGANSIEYDASHSGDYTVTLMDASCNATSNSTTVELLDKPTVSIEAPGGLDLCPNGVVKLKAESPDAISYQWYRNGILLSGATNSSNFIYRMGKYKVNVTNAGGCSILSKKAEVVSSCKELKYILPSSHAISLYPNPTSDDLNLQLSYVSGDVITISIIDLLGRITQSERIPADNNQANFILHLDSELVNGMYLLKVETRNQSLQKLFEVQR